MSQPFGLDHGSEENPEPEEDSGWCLAREGDDDGVEDFPQPEEPEAISEETSSGPSEETVAERERNGSVEHESVSNNLEVECLSSNDYVASSVAPEDDREPPGGHEGGGDSFEQDEELAAPESENGVMQQTCSESDQQLRGAHHQTEEEEEAVSEENSSVPESTRMATLSGSVEEQDSASVNVVNACEELSGEEACRSDPHEFSGNVQVDDCAGIDAPEDDIRLLQNDLPSEENAAFLPESGRVSVCAESPVIESQRLGENGVDSQVPECDRNEEAELSAEHSGSNSQPQPQASISQSASSGFQEENDNLSHKGAGDNYSTLEGKCVDANNCEMENGALCQTNSSEDNSDCVQSRIPVEPPIENPVEVAMKSSPSPSPSHVEGQLTHSIGNSSPRQSIPNNTNNDLPSSNNPREASDGSQPSPQESCPINPVTCSATSTVNLSSSPKTVGIENSSSVVSNPTPAPVASSSPSPSAATNTQTTVVGDSNTNFLSEPSFPSKADEATSLSDVSSSPSQQKERAAILPDELQKQLALALSKDDDEDDLDDIMSELDAALLSRNKGFSPQRSLSEHQSSLESKSSHDSSLGRKETDRMTNGMVGPDFKTLQGHNRQLLEQLKIRDDEIRKLNEERDSTKAELTKAQAQCQEALKKASAAAVSSSHNSDDLYLPQIKELEKALVEQQRETQQTKDKLVSHDAAAKKAVTTLQNELKNRVDQVTKLYEEAVKEKDSMVVMFAASESKVMESKRAVEKMELRLKDAIKERESLVSTVKAAKADRQMAINGLEKKTTEYCNMQKEMEKLKDALSSSDYRIKWFQNKLKDELEAHKDTKSSLEKTTHKLKEGKEETEIIRRECQAIVKTYQESEEIKSNSLDKELKMKESQFKLHMQQWTDTEEINQRTKKELESLKGHHREALFEVSTLKEKIHNLEMSWSEKETSISQSNELLNKQKTDLSELTSKLKERENLDENFNRAQEMIKNLDKDVSELKVSNRDLQKDMDSCRERESKMLALQSELSRTNACLRSENTHLSNKATNLMADVERLKMEVQEMETTVKHLTDSLEEEKKGNCQTLSKLKASVEEKTKESADLKQKWEDEIDSNKTLKRRHANNVKDLTRQLQQTKRRLESLEGSGKDSGGSMGSRTNSNGSLNSMDNSQPGMGPSSANHHHHHHHQHSGHSTTGSSSAPAQEFPVITEQVEIDKQVLIERIVRLQKSHARKNEKLEFLGEHIQQLLEEIKKKTKIIQSYVMREEAGTLSSEDMDANKSLLSRKGGIMASVYSLHQQDGTMTLELSLQINKKLQAVLEDTLLKNITLKENLDTLGEEIARLSQVNRKLQLHLQDLENSNKK